MLPAHPNGAQRASRHRSVSSLAVAALAAAVAIGGLASQPAVTRAATIKVVIVVGATGSKTGEYRTAAHQIAVQARSYGAKVYEIYSPYATWDRVRAAARGAKLLVYLGHGNGYPSPYGSFQTASKDGMGLNAAYNQGNSNTKYYGEKFMATLGLARNAVVILHRLCYASGNPEWGRPNPTLTVARQRVDNYGAGFLRAGARAVFAEGITSTSYILSGLFRSSANINRIFWSSPKATRTHYAFFRSGRTYAKYAVMDPYEPGRYYRSVIGDLGMLASSFRS